MRKIDPFGGQWLREGTEELNPSSFQNYNNRGIHDNLASMSLDDGMLRINAKLDNLMYLIEQHRNVNVWNSNNVVCDLYGGYHSNYQCMQA